MVLTNITKELRYKSLNRFSKFVLIGNNIDGFVNIDVVEFENFDEVKMKLPSIVKSLKFEGEWNLSLYQIPDNFKIKHLYGYYIVPQKGKLILELSYMNVCKNVNVLISDAIIHVFSTTGIRIYKDGEIAEILDNQVFEEYITILLYEETKNIKSHTTESFSIDDQIY